MTEPYTPSLEFLFYGYAYGKEQGLFVDMGKEKLAEHRAEFDRAIAAHDAEVRKRIAEEIRATNLGAPLVLNSDGTAYFLSGPELREEICAFITEGSGE